MIKEKLEKAIILKQNPHLSSKQIDNIFQGRSNTQTWNGMGTNLNSSNLWYGRVSR